MEDATREELLSWHDRSNVEWAALQAAELRFHESWSTGSEEHIRAAIDELAIASRDANAFAVADPCPDLVWRQSVLELLDLWSEVVVLLQKLALDRDAYEDGGETRLNALHAQMNALQEAIDERREEIARD